MDIDDGACFSYARYMSILDIIKIPDKILKEKSTPVERFDEELQLLLYNMLETMYAAPGIGLAAPQVGILRQIVTIDVAKPEEDAPPDAPRPMEPMCFVNPKIVWSSDEMSTYEEGCLSIPEFYAEIERPAEVIVQYQDQNGKEIELKTDGLLATCIQHEVDHLNGVLFIDYLSKLKRDRVIKKFTKIKKTEAL